MEVDERTDDTEESTENTGDWGRPGAAGIPLSLVLDVWESANKVARRHTRVCRVTAGYARKEPMAEVAEVANSQ